MLFVNTKTIRRLQVLSAIGDNGILLFQICKEDCIFNLQHTINVHVADGMCLIEQAGGINDWTIAYNCPNYTI